MVYVQPGRNAMPRPGWNTAATSGGGAAGSGNGTNGNGNGEKKEKAKGSNFIFVLAAVTAVVIAIAIGGWVAWINTHDAAAVAQSYAFEHAVTQKSTGIVDHTEVSLCQNFQSPAPNDPTVSPQCAHLPVSGYLEELDIKIDNTSTNTYKEVTVCGMLIGQNDNGPGQWPELARDNCVRFTNVGPGVTSEREIVSGQFPYSTHIVIIDDHGIATVNYHAIKGRSAYCSTANAPPFCA